MFAHSERLAFAKMIAPASLSLAATPLSRAAMCPSKAYEPAVVLMPSAVSMLSFTMMGMPWSGPRIVP